MDAPPKTHRVDRVTICSGENIFPAVAALVIRASAWQRRGRKTGAGRGQVVVVVVGFFFSSLFLSFPPSSILPRSSATEG